MPVVMAPVPSHSHVGCHPCGDSRVPLVVSSLLPPCCLWYFVSHWSVPTPDEVGWLFEDLEFVT